MQANLAILDPSPPTAIAAPQPLLVDLVVASGMISVGERFVRGLAQAGDLPCVRLGDRMLFRPADLAAWVAAGAPHDNWSRQQAEARAARAANPPSPRSKKKRRRVMAD